MICVSIERKRRVNKLEKSKKSFIINALRRASYRWYGRYTAEKRSALGKGWFFCELCGTADKNKKKNFQMDHIDPVISIDSTKNSLEEVCDRLFALPEGWQRLCKPCHKEKSALENAQRPIGDRAKGKRKKSLA